MAHRHDATDVAMLNRRMAKGAKDAQTMTNREASDIALGYCLILLAVCTIIAATVQYAVVQ